MTEAHVFPVPEGLGAKSWCDEQAYFRLYEQSVSDPEAFWGEQGKRIHWFKPYSQIKDVSFGPGDVHIRWYQDGTTPTTASTGTCLREKTKSPSSGRATTRATTRRSPMARPMPRSASWPMP
jgi:hypothetical protein